MVLKRRLNACTTMSHELSITRIIDAPPEKVFRTWIDRLPEWWALKPWTTQVDKLDFRSAGAFETTMRGPEGEVYPGRGVFLEVVENERIVFTDAYSEGWQPSATEPFFTGIITFGNEGGKTRYTATVRHWTEENCRKHEEMGFYPGWNQCIDQLSELATQS